MQTDVKRTSRAWVLRLKGLTKSYSDNILFRNLNLDIGPGMTVHVQGPNGSGKSQLMLVIAGLVEADAGRVIFSYQGELLLNGTDPASRARFTRYVSYSPGGLAEMPIDQALLVMTRRLRSFSLRSLNAAAASVVSELKKELRDVVDTSLELNRSLNQYSLGQQKRFMAVSSLSVEPYPFVVMLDEPLAGLDETGIARVLELMQEARARGIGLLVSEHRREIFNFSFDSALRLPYKPHSDAAPLTLISVNEGEVSDSAGKSETVLRATDLVAGYTGSPVHCSSLSVNRGELVFIQGPNGSGKTGFIRGLLGHPGTTMSGRLEFEGVLVPNMRVAQQQSALRYLSQKRDLFLDLTVRESIIVAGRGRETRLSGEIEDIILYLGPGKLVKHLSSGGRALLGLAQALAGEPKLLILDEPAATTDAVNRQRVWELISRACRQGDTAVLAIEHDLTPAPGSSVYRIEQQDKSSVLIPIVK
jgi:ABC-type multidrug transport system ATPase subunit